MSDYYVALMYPIFIILGFVSPFITSLGYVWVDTFYPQYVSLVLKGVPVALIMGSAAILGYVLLDRRSPPRLTLTIVLIVMMAIWVTLTSTWAVMPEEAWKKWDWAFKTVAFSAFIPFVIRSRVQIEAFLLVFLFSIALHILPFGAKAVLSGGGYGKELGFLKTNVGMEEGSTLSAVAIMSIPLLLHLRRHSLIIPDLTQRTVVFGGYALACCTAPIATFARTAIIGFAVLGTFLWLQSRRKLLMAAAVVVAAIILVVATPESWQSRISTIETYDEDTSASGRILVWRWTLDFATSHPLGGGFSAYMVNHIVTEDGREIWSKAFHSIYFETLGEHGWVGLAIYLTLILTTIISLRQTLRRTRDSPELAWCNDLTRAMFTSFLVLITCGAFIGIAFQPMIWYMFALTTCVSEYVRRAQAPAKISRWAPRPEIATPGAAAARLAP
jgi:putative inorganic carbon (HCO3(-)) transporter